MTIEQITKLSNQNAYIECIVHTEASEGSKILADMEEDYGDKYEAVVNGVGYVALVYVKYRKYHESNLSWRLYHGITRMILVHTEKIEDIVNECIKAVYEEIEGMKN